MAYEIPEPTDNPTAALVMNYKILKEVQYDDRGWDKRHWGRCARSAQELLEICKIYESARRCLEELAEQFKETNLSWTFETITKHAHDWKNSKEKKNDQQIRARSLDALAQQRSSTAIKIEGTLNGSEMVDSLRNLDVIPLGIRREEKLGNEANGKARRTV